MPRKGPRFIDGAAFRRARIRFKFRQIDVATILGVDETTVQRWEGGQTKRVRRVYLEKLRDEYLKKRGA